MKIALIICAFLACFEVTIDDRPRPWIRSMFCTATLILSIVLFLMERQM